MKWVVAGILTSLLALPGSAAAQRPQVLRVEMREFSFRPALLRVAAERPIRLLFVNRGQLAHQFEADYLRKIAVTIETSVSRVEAPGLDILRLEPGGTATLEFVPRQKGRFAFACTIEGHREAGMAGVLDVR